MTTNRNGRNRRRRNGNGTSRRQRRPKLAIKQSLPNQETTDVTFVDVFNVQPLGLVPGDQRQWVTIGPNGFGFDASGTIIPPQQVLWNTYARMYEKYTVMSIRSHFTPFRFRYQPGQVAGGTQVKEVPTFSIIDVNLSGPQDMGSFAAHGPKNFKQSPPGVVHHRDYLNLQSVLIKNQQTTLRSTNGTWASREQYAANSNIRYQMTSPVNSNEVFGILTVQYTYRFIGKNRSGDGNYDMTKIDEVKQAYVDHSLQRSRSVQGFLPDSSMVDESSNKQPQTSDTKSQGSVATADMIFNR